MRRPKELTAVSLTLDPGAAWANDTLKASVTGIGHRRRYQVSQLVGARNSRPAPEVVKVVRTFVEEVNNRVRVATMVGRNSSRVRRRRLQ